jgi:hypothetical protein
MIFKDLNLLEIVNLFDNHPLNKKDKHHHYLLFSNLKLILTLIKIPLS